MNHAVRRLTGRDFWYKKVKRISGRRRCTIQNLQGEKYEKIQAKFWKEDIEAGTCIFNLTVGDKVEGS
jgi:hypothetical protein